MKKKHKNRHHILPSSRGGTDEKYNTVMVDKKLHDLYHRLFVNKTPDEIIEFLVTYFWKGQRHWVVDNEVDNNVYCNCSACSE